jgi:hypothetical protein
MPSGPGANNAEGVYLYGETDVQALASDLLNLSPTSISLVLAAHRLRLEALEQRPTGVFTRSSNVNVTTSAAAIAFTTAATLVGLTWSSVTNPSRITATKAGRYLVSGHWQINTTANASVFVRKNGATQVGPTFTVTGVAGAATFDVIQPVDLAVGDYIELIAVITGTSPQPWVAAGSAVNVDLLALR